MAILDPFEIVVGWRLVNALLVDARRLNFAQDLYTDTTQVLTENLLAVRKQGQIYYVINGSGFDAYWFNGGVADGDLKLMFSAVINSGLEALDEGNGIGW